MGFECSNPFSLPAGVDLSESQYCAVAVATLGDHSALVLPSAGGAAIGILYTRPTVGKAGQVYGPGTGIRKARYGGAVPLPAVLKVDAQGRFVVASAADVAAGAAVAIAVEAGAADEIRSVLFLGGFGASQP